MSSNPIIWAAALMTIFSFSYLYKENEFYRATEHLYIGVAAGYTMVQGYNNIISKVWQPVMTKGQLGGLLPAALGLLLFAGFFGNQYRWLRRFPIAIVVGIGAALNARASVTQELIVQVRSGMVAITNLDSLIILVGTLSVLCYFFFTFKQNAVTRTGSEVGKWFIMLTFGAAFGNGIMGRISLLIGRLFLLFQDWIPLIRKA